MVSYKFVFEVVVIVKNLFELSMNTELYKKDTPRLFEILTVTTAMCFVVLYTAEAQRQRCGDNILLRRRLNSVHAQGVQYYCIM